jgi:hypothetical protein
MVGDGRRDDVTVIWSRLTPKPIWPIWSPQIPAARFLSKPELSASAIRRIVDGRSG